jgi:hypothetical protein
MRGGTAVALSVVVKSIDLRLVTFLALAPAAACSYQLVSPPARMVNMETARTAAPGETVVGVHGGAYSAVFDPAVVVGTAGVKRGVAPDVEVSAEATWARLVYDGFAGIDRNIFAGRVGAKAANRQGWGALTAGVGGGVAPAAGGFAAIDAGAVVSYPNCYVVPFGNGTLFASLPFATKQVDFVNSNGTLAGSDKADPTLGFGLSAGIEIPLDRDRCRQGLTPARIQLGASGYSMFPSDGKIVTTTTDPSGMTTTSSRGGRYGAVGLAAGVEFPF